MKKTKYFIDEKNCYNDKTSGEADVFDDAFYPAQAESELERVESLYAQLAEILYSVLARVARAEKKLKIN